MPHKNILRKIDAAALIENATNPRPGKRSPDSTRTKPQRISNSLVCPKN